MVRSGTPEPAGGDQSLGDLVSLATKDISQLVRYEIDLAKTELRGDLRRVATAGVLFVIMAFFGSLVLLSASFAYGYGLHAAGAPGGVSGAFAFVSLTWFLLGLAAGVFAVLLMRHLSRMKKTRESVTEGLGMLRRDGKDGQGNAKAAGDGRGRGPLRFGSRRGIPEKQDDSALPDGQRAEIAGQKPR
jgi:Putative Actinobacterial Holin-X, holin superfamily III